MSFHRDDLHGFESLDSSLLAGGRPERHHVDRHVVSDGGPGRRARRRRRRSEVGDAADFQVSTLDATRQLGHRSDVQLPRCATERFGLRSSARTATGTFLSAKRIQGISFAGVIRRCRRCPLEWTVDADPADQPGDAASSPGRKTTSTDRSFGRSTSRPGRLQLTFDADWSLEEGFDYGYVQVSTDGGDSYETIPCSDQVEGPLGSAFNGESDAFLPETCDLSRVRRTDRGDRVPDGHRLAASTSTASGSTTWPSTARSCPTDRRSSDGARRPSSTRSTSRATRCGSSRTTRSGHDVLTGHGIVTAATDMWKEAWIDDDARSIATSRAWLCGAERSVKAIGSRADVVSVHRHLSRLHGAGAAIRAVHGSG